MLRAVISGVPTRDAAHAKRGAPARRSRPRYALVSWNCLPRSVATEPPVGSSSRRGLGDEPASSYPRTGTGTFARPRGRERMGVEPDSVSELVERDPGRARVVTLERVNLGDRGRRHVIGGRRRWRTSRLLPDLGVRWSDCRRVRGRRLVSERSVRFRRAGAGSSSCGATTTTRGAARSGGRTGPGASGRRQSRHCGDGSCAARIALTASRCWMQREYSVSFRRATGRVARSLSRAIAAASAHARLLASSTRSVDRDAVRRWSGGTAPAPPDPAQGGCPPPGTPARGKPDRRGALRRRRLVPGRRWGVTRAARFGSGTGPHDRRRTTERLPQRVCTCSQSIVQTVEHTTGFCATSNVEAPPDPSSDPFDVSLAQPPVRTRTGAHA